MNESCEVRFGSTNISLNASPINPDWILEGQPLARNRVLSSSEDGTACTLVWDCSAGRFNWFYDIDETVCILEGSVLVKDGKGQARRVEAGDTVFFPAGSHAEWTVEDYVRKVAFCRSPLPWQVRVMKSFYRGLKRLMGRGAPAGQGASGPAMFGGAPTT